MVFDFLFWFYLVGLLLAVFQDLKRREIDNWLNLFLLVGGLSFLAIRAIFEMNGSYIVFGIVSFLMMFVLANLFYYGRIFAGGDAKLLFAMFALFVSFGFYETLLNIGLFVFFLMVAGSVYGLSYSSVLFVKNYDKIKKELGRQMRNIYLRYAIFAGVILVGLSFVEFLFLIPAVFLLVFPFLYVLSKSLENVTMVKGVKVSELREGDWLVEDVRIGKGKVVKAGWDGLSEDELKLLSRVKEKIKIKQGIPFVPAFLLAFILWQFRDLIIAWVL